MLLASIIAIILFGIILIVLEILVLPGLIAGIIGAIFMIMGLVMMYKNYGDVYGNITLIATIVLTASALIYALKSKAWRRFGLKDTIDSKVIDLQKEHIEPGTIAITTSALRPMGTVIIGMNKYEAQTSGAYIEANSEVVVLKVLTNKLLVELKS
ncbi:MAG: NfeD family protein [Bacteroidia bacterium]